MRERDERESPSGAMRGSGEGAGSADLPYPRTDADDTGLGDGGLAREAERRAARGDDALGTVDLPTRGRARGEDPVGPGRDDDARGRGRGHGGWGDEGIGGGRAGGTGL
jgi:hypothetical protein